MSSRHILSLAMLEQQMFARAQYAGQKLEEELTRIRNMLESVKNREEIWKLEKRRANCLETQRILDLSISRINTEKN